MTCHQGRALGLAATVLSLIGPHLPLVPAATPGANPSPIPRQVFCAANASAPERYAAEQLVQILRSIIGDDAAVPPVLNATASVASIPQFAVGYDAARLVGVPADSMAHLGREGYLLQPAAAGASLALSGARGAPRGALYAVNEFLEAIGVQFLAADVTVLPKQLPPTWPALRPRYVPQLEYRQTFGFQMLAAPDFNVHLRLNKAHYNNNAPELDARHGGVYPIFAKLGTGPSDSHTSYSLLDGLNHGLGGPPSELFKAHRGWFWPQADNASGIYGQLCWSNSSLQAFLVQRIKMYLAAQPQATVISVSQNDNSFMCQTPEELAIVQAENATMGPMMRAINYIADHIKGEYPDVAVHTLAYGETTDPPRITKARPNVVVQLAPIGADYGRPFTAPSNAKIRALISGWGKKCSRLFVWNYVGGFECFLLPFPNYYALAQDITFMAENGVTGIFNEAAYTGAGGDFAEHNDYVVSKMMFEPSLNGTELSSQFIRSYYGAAAAPHILEYMGVLTRKMLVLDYHMEEAGWDMNSFAPIFDVETVVRAGAALKAALAAATAAAGIGGDPAHAQRVEMSSLSLYWVLIHRFGELRYGADLRGLAWPFQSTATGSFDAFARLWNASAARYTPGSQPSLGEGDTRTLRDLADENLQLCPGSGGGGGGLREGQLITLFNGGVRNGSGAIGPEVIATASNASSWGEQYCPPGSANLPTCHYTFSVLGHWVSALAPTAGVPQWLEWDFRLRPGMGLGHVTALQLPAADGFVHHQLLFDSNVVTEWTRSLVVDASAVKPAPSYCEVVFSAVRDCPDRRNASSCGSNPPLTWAMPSVKVNLSPNPAKANALARGCRRDLLFEYSPTDGKSVAVSKARLLSKEVAGSWVAWSAVTFTMCPLHSRLHDTL